MKGGVARKPNETGAEHQVRVLKAEVADLRKRIAELEEGRARPRRRLQLVLRVTDGPEVVRRVKALWTEASADRAEALDPSCEREPRELFHEVLVEEMQREAAEALPGMLRELLAAVEVKRCGS